MDLDFVDGLKEALVIKKDEFDPEIKKKCVGYDSYYQSCYLDQRPKVGTTRKTEIRVWNQDKFVIIRGVLLIAVMLSALTSFTCISVIKQAK